MVSVIDVENAQQAWGEGIVAISKAHSTGSDYIKRARLHIESLYRILTTLKDVGLGYVRLGQPATTLSGGEAQRVKLASELHRPTRSHTVYILDEPTTGPSLFDVHQLTEVLLRLRRNGHTVIVIEHHLDVIKCADWVIDLGPEGGERGGNIIAQGTPQEISNNLNSFTGKHLQNLL